MRDNMFLQHKRGKVIIAFLCGYPVKFLGLEVLLPAARGIVGNLREGIVPGLVKKNGIWETQASLYREESSGMLILTNLLKQKEIDYILVEKDVHRAIKNMRDRSQFLRTEYGRIHTPDHILKGKKDGTFTTVYETKFYS